MFHCNTLQHTATHCNSLQHPATLFRCRTHTGTRNGTKNGMGNLSKRPLFRAPRPNLACRRGTSLRDLPSGGGAVCCSHVASCHTSSTLWGAFERAGGIQMKDGRLKAESLSCGCTSSSCSSVALVLFLCCCTSWAVGVVVLYRGAC